LPLVMLSIAAFNPYPLSARTRSFAAFILAVVSAVATVEAVLRVDWAGG